MEDLERSVVVRDTWTFPTVIPFPSALDSSNTLERPSKRFRTTRAVVGGGVVVEVVVVVW